MRVIDALRDAGRTRELLDPSSARFVTGTPEQQSEAREEWRRQVRARKIVASDRTEIPRSELAFGKYGIVEHTATSDGAYFRICESPDPDYAAGASAYFFGSDGLPILLERVTDKPRSRAERDRIRSEREARRTAPKQKPAWMQK